MDARAGGVGVSSIQEINQLPREMAEGLYARLVPDDRDPALLVDVEMSARSVPALAFVQITNPRAARYGIDRDPEGRDTLFGTVSRNVDEEIRARNDGLAPGQWR